MHQLEEPNPFAPIRAADYTDAQINELWVELGAPKIEAILQPGSKVSKYILGSKGSGKTHLLRYYSYPVARLRAPRASGLSIVRDNRCLAVFLRTTNMDAGRFELPSQASSAWQHLFSVHLELRLVDLVVEALRDIAASTPEETFDDAALISHIGRRVLDPAFHAVTALPQLQAWITSAVRRIDTAVNAAAFTRKVDIQLPFSPGDFALAIGGALKEWHPSFEQLNLLYILDEIENLSEKQQEVVNTLIRYAEARAAFRVSGRLYARKTLATIAEGEENREGSEFNVTRLDEVLRAFGNYSQFARRFVAKRLHPYIINPRNAAARLAGTDLRALFDEVNIDAAAERFDTPPAEARFAKMFKQALMRARGGRAFTAADTEMILSILVQHAPPLLQRLNVLLFCKKFRPRTEAHLLAKKIALDCERFLNDGPRPSTYYSNALGHWKGDLFAQLCRESRRRDAVLPYAGFDTFVSMSSHNPRNLLVLLGKVYEVASFRGVDFAGGAKLPVDVQTEAALDAARFAFEADSNYGLRSDQARDAVNRLAEVLRTARYALNIPEVSPIVVSFNNDELSECARRTLESALNFSLVFEISEGRPDRNTQRIRRKIQLNPMLSPRWGLPTGRRGDVGLTGEIATAIFDGVAAAESFELLLRQLDTRWNGPFDRNSTAVPQATLL